MRKVLSNMKIIWIYNDKTVTNLYLFCIIIIIILIKHSFKDV